MKKNIFLFIVIIFCVSCGNNIIAQKDTGHILYKHEIYPKAILTEDQQEFASMMPDLIEFDINLYHNSTTVRTIAKKTENNSSAMMNIPLPDIIYLKNSETQYEIFDGIFTERELNSKKYIETGKTKKILGYNCKEYLSEGENEVMGNKISYSDTIYITTELGKNINPIGNVKIEGTILKISSKTHKYIAVKIDNDKCDDKLFEINKNKETNSNKEEQEIKYNPDNKVFYKNKKSEYTVKQVIENDTLPYTTTFNNEKVQITRIELVVTGKKTIGQTEIIFNYYDKDKFIAKEITGIVENKKIIFSHPPRSFDFYLMTEFAPFPTLQYPIKKGSKWSSVVSLMNFATAETGKKVKTKFEIISTNTIINGMETIEVHSTGECGLGIFEHTFYFNQKQGFVIMKYKNPKGEQLIFELN